MNMRTLFCAVYKLIFGIKSNLSKLKNKVKLLLLRTFCNISVMDSPKTIQYIIEHKCCVARYGDGELGMLFGVHDIGFQKHDDKLSEKLCKVIECRPENLLLCIPKYLLSEKNLCGYAYHYWHTWNQKNLAMTIKFLKQKSKTKVFGDTQITRPYMDRQDRDFARMIFDDLKRIWDKKDIIIIEGVSTRLGVGNDLFANTKSIKRVIAPSKQAFSVYDRLISTIEEIYNGELILIALGPTATCLAYDFAKMNYWAIDIGHVDIEYEWYLRGFSKKTAIEGKYVNEAKNGDTFIPCYDKEYLDSIFCKIQEG